MESRGGSTQIVSRRYVPGVQSTPVSTNWNPGPGSSTTRMLPKRSKRTRAVTVLCDVACRSTS